MYLIVSILGFLVVSMMIHQNFTKSSIEYVEEKPLVEAIDADAKPVDTKPADTKPPNFNK